MSDFSPPQASPSIESLGRSESFERPSEAEQSQFAWWARLCSEEPWQPGHADHSRWERMWNDHNFAACKSIYQNLDAERHQMRVLKVDFGENGIDLHCSLHTISLDYDVRYTCLSYAWENANARRPIWLNGRLYLVTTSLHAALCGLRRKDACDPYIFADGLCISQHDIVERQQQVALMARVYSQAKTVQVWLGKGNTGIDEAMSMIKHARYHLPKDLLLQMGDTHWDDFTSLPWFSRLWVVQESLLARQLLFHYGEHTLDNESLQTFEERLVEGVTQAVLEPSSYKREVWITFSRFCESVAAINDQYKDIPSSAASNADDIMGFLWDVKEKSATDSRDYLYALLGTLPPALGIVVRYNDPVETVFRDATMSLMRWSNSLSWLQIANSLADPGLPTWCIDFGCIYGPIPAREGTCNFLACGGSIPSIDYHAEGALLVVPSLLVEPVAHVCAPFVFNAERTAHGAHHLPRLRECRSLVRAVVPAGGQHPMELSGRFWRMISMHKVSGLENKPKRYDLQSLPIDGLDRWMTTGSDPPAPSEDFDVNFDFMRLAGKTFFVTSSGRLGLAWRTPEPGDKIVVLAGLVWPVLLRESQRNLRTVYLFIGFCYCEDIMYGEAVPPSAKNVEGENLLGHGFEMISLI